MASCFIFNPENDLALASGQERYTPPAHAAMLARAGALLPLWYSGGEGDVVIASDTDSGWIDSIRRDFGVRAAVLPVVSGAFECCPWGWSAYAAGLFRRAGVDTGCLPSAERIAGMRLLSHRRTTVDIYRALGWDIEPPAECFTAADVGRMLHAHPDGIFFKAPWSSTGRGVASSLKVPQAEVIRRCEGIIRRQGSVMVEPALDRISDFAMLFHAGPDGTVGWRGYSMFSSMRNAYTGNILLPDSEIETRISRQLTDPEQLAELRHRLPGILAAVIGGRYVGWLGVDMMLYRHSDGSVRVAPCVEINLRMTMGVVAQIWRQRYLHPDVSAAMTVTYGNTSEISRERPVIESYRLVRGAVSLIAPSGDFRIAVTTL